MISLAQAVIDPAQAIGEDGKPPSSLSEKHGW